MTDPRISGGRERRRFDLGDRVAVLLDEIASDGPVNYLRAVVVLAKDTEKAVYFVVAQEGFSDEEGHRWTLATYGPEGMESHGDDEDWEDEETFESRALAIIGERFGAEPREL